jgi:hypothetical protein
VKWVHASRYSVSHKKLQVPWSACKWLKVTAVTWTRILCSTGRITLRNWMFSSGFVSLSVCVRRQAECLIDKLNKNSTLLNESSKRTEKGKRRKVCSEVNFLDYNVLKQSVTLLYSTISVHNRTDCLFYIIVTFT